jgi:predicted dehydrogenase
MVHAVSTPDADLAPELAQSFLATLRCENGVLASILYAGNGDTRLSKERIECYGGGVAAVIDDFRQLDLFEGGKKKSFKDRGDKGHRAQMNHFLKALRGDEDPMPVETYLASTRATLAMAESLRTGRPVGVN